MGPQPSPRPRDGPARGRHTHDEERRHSAATTIAPRHDIAGEPEVVEHHQAHNQVDEAL